MTMNSIYLYLLIFFASFILLYLCINFIVAFYKYNEANREINTFIEKSSSRFLVFENINVSYCHSAKDSTTIGFAYDKKADLYWSESTLIIIRKRKFILLGSWLPTVFTISAGAIHAEDSLPSMLFVVDKVIDKGYAKPEITFISRTSLLRLKGLDIEITLSGITTEQLVLLKKCSINI